MDKRADALISFFKVLNSTDDKDIIARAADNLYDDAYQAGYDVGSTESDDDWAYKIGGAF